MSKDSVKQMFGQIEKDAALRENYAKLMQARQIEAEKDLAEKLIELGQTAGFSFSKEDLMAARAELMDNINSNKELADGDLANVAGGGVGMKAFVGVMSVVTIGLGCGIDGIVSAIFDGIKNGTCGDKLSLTASC